MSNTDNAQMLKQKTHNLLNEYMAELKHIVSGNYPAGSKLPEWFSPNSPICCGWNGFVCYKAGATSLGGADKLTVKLWVIGREELRTVFESQSLCLTYPFNQYGSEDIAYEIMTGTVYSNPKRLEFIMNWKPL